MPKTLEVRWLFFLIVFGAAGSLVGLAAAAESGPALQPRKDPPRPATRLGHVRLLPWGSWGA